MTEPSETIGRRLAAVPTAAGVATRLAVAEVNRRGIDPGPLLARVGLSAVALDHGGRIDVRSQIEFLELASRAVGDDFLGLTLAEQFDLRELGMLYYVAASSHRVGDALRRLERYVRVANEALIAGCTRGRRAASSSPIPACPGTSTGTRSSSSHWRSSVSVGNWSARGSPRSTRISFTTARAICAACGTFWAATSGSIHERDDLSIRPGGAGPAR